MWPFSRREPPAEQRHWVDGTAFTSFGDLQSGNTKAGVSITQDTALALPVVYSCINLNSQVIASLPVDCFAKRDDEQVPYPEPFWLTSPNDEQDWGEFIAQILVSRYKDGNAFVLKAAAPNGKLSSMYVMNPAATVPKRAVVGGKHVIVYESTTAAGNKVELAANEVLHIKGLTLPGHLRALSPIAAAREMLGLSAAAQEYSSRFYGDGATVSGMVESPASLNKEQADRIKESMTRQHGGLSKSHALGVLSGGATFKQITVNPDDALALDAMKLTGVQIAHLFGVPPYKVTQDDEGAKGYVTSLLASRMDWYTDGLQPEIVRLERAFSTLLPRPAFIKFNMRAFLRGNAAETAAQMTSEVQNGVRSPEEWRTLLDYGPSGLPTRYYMQGGTFVLDDDGNPVPPKAPAAEEPAAPEPEEPEPEEAPPAVAADEEDDSEVE